MKKLKRYPLAPLLVVLLFLLTTTVVAAATTYSTYDNVYDGYLWCWDAPAPGGYALQQALEDLDAGNYGDRYLTNAIGGDEFNLYVGQYWNVGTGYYIYRGLLVFDTSDIPRGATVTAATLTLRAAGKFIDTTNFDITVVNGAGCSIPAIDTDYGLLGDRNTSGGTINTASYGVGEEFQITLNADGRSWVTVDGWTIFGLRSSRDISATAPVNSEYVCIEPYEWGVVHPDQRPLLTVTYDPPGVSMFGRLMPVVVAAAVVIGAVVLRNPAALVVGAIIGIIAFSVAQAIL